MPLGMSKTVEFILDERFGKLYQLKPLPEFDGTRKENFKKRQLLTVRFFSFYHIL